MGIHDNMSFCYRCYHAWKRRSPKIPKYCPKCKSPYWNKPRKRSPKELILLLVKEIIGIHDDIIRLSGGLEGTRNDGGIYHAVVNMLNYQMRHRGDIIGLGAFILNQFAKEHYFNDGNKRTAYVLAKMFMLINRCHLSTTYKDSVNFILDVAKYQSPIEFQEIKSWLKERCTVVEEKDVEKYLKDILYKVIIEMRENERAN